MGFIENTARVAQRLKDKSSVTILAVETSCDETSCAVVQNGRNILSNVISSQVDFHKRFGGVVPEIASRKHIELIDYVVDDALEQAGMDLNGIDAIAVTNGPGLVGALLVGVSHAKAMAFAVGIPIVAVHHIEGHICANYLAHQKLVPPFVCLVVSGGHSHLVHVKGYGEYAIMGRTRDDAAGEAFDKVARALGLGYPGGPLLEALAQNGSPNAVAFPRTYLEKGSLDFSFSGLKTAVLNHLNSCIQKGEVIDNADIAASFQQALIDVLVDKAIYAAQQAGVNTLALAGGVAANGRLREVLADSAKKADIQLKYPPKILCTDNAAMIASAAYYRLLKGRISDLTLNAVASIEMDSY